MNQARLIDVHRYYRQGGINPALLSMLDGVIISAGVGLYENELLKEQVDLAVACGIPYATYHIPTPLLTMKEQVKHYLSLYGVRDGLTFIDIEPPSRKVRCVNAGESFSYCRYIRDETGDLPGVYSNPLYLDQIGKPAWLNDHWLWIAAWPYQFGWPLNWQYKDFDSFLARYANVYPSYVRGTTLQDNTILWQFSCKGDAQRLIANADTQDPVFTKGIKECDLNVSLVDKIILMDLLAGDPPPPVPPPTGDWYFVSMAERNIRATPNAISGKVLLTLHYGDQVQVSNIVSGTPGQWGVTVAYKINGESHPCLNNYIYMNNLVKSP